MLEEIKRKINQKTKPVGSLGLIEKIAEQICEVQQTLSPSLIHPTLVVFAGDHGIAHSGVSAYPPEVTPQMVMNFLEGGAAINIFCRQNGLKLLIVDSGVNYNFSPHPNLIDAKVEKGTRNFLTERAMQAEQVEECFRKAEEIIDKISSSGCNVIGFGEMGIGNTSSASLLVSSMMPLPIDECVGKGTGLDAEQLSQKLKLLIQAQQHHRTPENAMEALEYFGGFEIVQMCGAMLHAFRKNMLILVDGFIASSAFLCAYRLTPEIIKNAIFCHQSQEFGHRRLLEYLEAKPVLQLDLRLGEGTGCALAFPLIQSAVNFVNEMASFESAGISNEK